MTTATERKERMSSRQARARTCLAIVLAAGEGTRMRSLRPKVLHAVAGRTLLAHVLTDGAAVSVLGFRPADPAGYGRLVTAGSELLAMVEHADANDSQRAITLCNGGLMALSGKDALTILEKIGNDNRKHEFYLTDA